MPLTGKTIAVLGGSGAEGSGLAFRWAHAGHTVIIGSRDAPKAEAAAAELNTLLQAAGSAARIAGMDNAAAAARSDVAVLTVPYTAQQATALAVKMHLAGKILVDVTVPLVPPKVDRVQLPAGRSAVEQLAEALGPEVQVVAAFQNVGAHHLKDLAHEIDCDVLVCADTKAAREVAIALAAAAGLVGIHAGPLANAAAVEAMTSVLIAINKAYKAKASGVRITGLPPRTGSSGGGAA